MIPAASQVTAALEGLFVVEDWHNFGTDYDRTLMAWRDNFDRAWPELSSHYDERFRRMWRFYLAVSAAVFRSRRDQLWQLVLSPDGVRTTDEWKAAARMPVAALRGAGSRNAALAKRNGCAYTINYNTENVVKVVNEITGGRGVPVVYDGVGKSTFEDSIACLKTRGMMVSFGNASGPLEKIDITKYISPKSLFFSRPTLGHYISARKELVEATDKLFEQLKYGKVKIEIYKKYKLAEVIQAHKDLESRKIIGPAIIIP